MGPITRTIARSSNVVLYENKMHKQSLKDVEVRKVTFKDIVPFVDVKWKNLIIVDASTCAQPRKTIIRLHDDAHHNDVYHAQLDGIQVQESLRRSRCVSKLPSNLLIM